MSTLTLKTTFQYLKADANRRILLDGRVGFLSKCLMFFNRGMVGVICYRFSRYFVLNGFGWLYRVILIIEHYYPKNEISPLADIGPGLVLADVGAIGVPSHTLVGENCTFLGGNTLTLGAIEGVDLEVDKIVLGDHCVLGARTKVMRAVTLASGTQIVDNSVVMFSIKKPGTLVAGVPARRVRRDNYDDVVRWNPIRSGYLVEGGK